MDNDQTGIEWRVVQRTFGENVRAAMQRAGINQTELAERVKTSKGQVSTWMKAENVELDNLFRIAKALNVSIESLIEHIDPEYDAMRQAAPRTDRFPELWARVGQKAQRYWWGLLLVYAGAPEEPDDEPPTVPPSPQ